MCFDLLGLLQGSLLVVGSDTCGARAHAFKAASENAVRFIVFRAFSRMPLLFFSRARLRFAGCSEALLFLAFQCCFVEYVPFAVSLVVPLELPGIILPLFGTALLSFLLAWV